ncbi:MAG: hypothetical protein KAV45_07415 [Calditrichia bacterium]|nr:hypothetical protein [Calditrichia bacterium]
MRKINNVNQDELQPIPNFKIWQKLNYNYSAPAIHSNTIDFPVAMIFNRKPFDNQPKVDYGKISENEWHRAMASNPLLESIYDPAEDIYTLDDGVPFNDEG